MNKFIHPEQFVGELTDFFNSSELGRLFKESTPEQRQEIADALSHFLGGGFPPRQPINEPPQAGQGLTTAPSPEGHAAGPASGSPDKTDQHSK